MTATAPATDADLVVQSLNGDRDSFGQIVSRYQSLVCSLAYSATGSLGQSEDIAQETFITAWRHLSHLRERGKLRAWLCGIARNRINNTLRRERREPLKTSEPLETADEVATSAPEPNDAAIAKEEEALLWRSLENIPENYREPLVLFYREHQSIEKVAESLDLSEDVVKQRLSRGRKLLHREVLGFVEGALARTNPSKAFTIGVVAALPLMATSAKAATLGAAAVNGSAVAKASAMMGLSGVLLGPLVGVVAGWLGIKTSLENISSERERQFIYGGIRKILILTAIFALAQIGLALAVAFLWKTHALLVVLGYTLGTIAYAGIICLWALKWNRQLIKIRREAGTETRKPQICWSTEYRSQWSFLGLPLIHVQTGKQDDGNSSFAKGWIAIGDKAVGFIAVGGLSIGIISLGGFSLGVIGIGGVTLGLLAAGGCAVGGWAVGGASIGYVAIGGCSLAWQAAMGGMAVARDYALGGTAQALHANDDIARAFASSNYFLAHSDGWFSKLMLVCWLPMIMVIWQMVAIRKAKKAQAGIP